MPINMNHRHRLTTAEAARYLGVTSRFLEMDRYYSNQEGKDPSIPYVKLGYRTIRYNLTDLDRYLDDNRVG